MEKHIFFFCIFTAGALFKTADISVNNEPISAAGSQYHYRAYLEALLQYGPDAKNSWLTQEFYYEDTPGAFNNLDPLAVPFNEGMDTRLKLTANSKPFDLLFTPRLEMFNQIRMLTPGDIQLKFTRTPASFYVMSDDPTKEYRIRILSGCFFLRTLKMSEAFDNKLERSMNEEKLPAKYPMLRSDVITFLIPYGTRSVSHPISKMGRQPIRMYLAFVENDTFNGNYQKNPYEFKHFELTSADFIINGKTFPTVPLKISYDAVGDSTQDKTPSTFLRALNELHRTTGVLDRNDGNGINRSKFMNGFFILGIKTTEAASDTGFAPPNQGFITINLTFGKAVPALSAILFMEYQNTVSINKLGVVTKGYTV